MWNRLIKNIKMARKPMIYKNYQAFLKGDQKLIINKPSGSL